MKTLARSIRYSNAHMLYILEEFSHEQFHSNTTFPWYTSYYYYISVGIHCWFMVLLIACYNTHCNIVWPGTIDCGCIGMSIFFSTYHLRFNFIDFLTILLWDMFQPFVQCSVAPCSIILRPLTFLSLDDSVLISTRYPEIEVMMVCIELIADCRYLFKLCWNLSIEWC